MTGGYRVYLRRNCSGVKRRKGHYGVRVAVKEKIVEKPSKLSYGKEGITIECISKHLLKARISIKSSLVQLVVAYSPTETAAER